jgi:hypothetical protein
VLYYKNKNKSVFLQSEFIFLNQNHYYIIMSDSTIQIVGFAFFALSELLPLLPIPANGFLHSLFIGLKNSFAKRSKNVDLEIAQSLVNMRPEFVELVNTIEGNSNLIDTLKMLTKSPELVSLVQKIADDKNLQLINTLLINNPDIKTETKRSIFSKLSDIHINIQTTNNQNLEDIIIEN